MIEHEILTVRTRLRPITPSDLESVHALHSLPETDEYNTLGIPKNIGETKAIIELWLSDHRPSHVLVIEDRLTQEFMGLFGLKLWDKKHRRAEVWYKVLPSFWNKGIATEALVAMIDFCFKKLDLHRIQAGCAVENTASIKVLEKAGMTREGRGRQILPLKSGWSDNFEYSILETD